MRGEGLKSQAAIPWKAPLAPCPSSSPYARSSVVSFPLFLCRKVGVESRLFFSFFFEARARRKAVLPRERRSETNRVGLPAAWREDNEIKGQIKTPKKLEEILQPAESSKANGKKVKLEGFFGNGSVLQKFEVRVCRIDKLICITIRIHDFLKTVLSCSFGE